MAHSMTLEQLHAAKHKRTDYTPHRILQMFAGAFIFAIFILVSSIYILRSYYGEAPNTAYLSFSPTYAFATASVSLVLSFLIPYYMMSTAKAEMAGLSKKERNEDLPTIFIPGMFIRYTLLSVVTIIGLIVEVSGQGFMLSFPFAAVSIGLMIAYFPTEARMGGKLRG
jgi:hypothetical protein